MASAFTHAIVAIAGGKAVWARKMPAKLWVGSVLCSVIPDSDVVGFAFGIKYQDFLGHRGFSHSLIFAVILSVLVVASAFKETAKFSKPWWALWVYFFLVTASHGLLDAMTNGGLGIAFFSPFDNTRYFLPWRPVEVSPIGIGAFFNSEGAAVMVSEIKYIWVPVAVVCFCWVGIRKLCEMRQG